MFRRQIQAQKAVFCQILEKNRGDLRFINLRRVGWEAGEEKMIARSFNRESIIPHITHAQDPVREAGRVREILENAFGEKPGSVPEPTPPAA
jgi:hypothetical protein